MANCETCGHKLTTLHRTVWDSGTHSHTVQTWTHVETWRDVDCDPVPQGFTKRQLAKERKAARDARARSARRLLDD